MRYVFRSCLLAGLAWSVFSWSQSRPLRHPPGILVAAEPQQGSCEQHSLGQFKKYTLTAVATYAIQARVLHIKRYWVDGSDLVPYDVALGWGRMSDQSVLDELRISQSNRFFFYEWQDASPIPENEIACHAANNHIIAANREVAKAVRALRAGQLVTMRGSLVNVTGPNGFRWNSSLSRADFGSGACELFYVESLQTLDPAPPAPSAPIAARQ